jgi:peptidoglycan/xylan/chitin deacetylase (PgdA/CDA1 family)
LFKAHLDCVARGRINPDHLVTSIGRGFGGTYLLLTFDDGGKSATWIGDELSRRGWRGHFFVTTSRIGTSRFVSEADIRYLRSCGHLVGSHSHTHPDVFKALTPARMRREWHVSTSAIADILGEPCVVASVPGGDVSKAVLEVAAESGIRYLFTSDPNLVPQRVGQALVLGRVNPRLHTPLSRVEELARFEGWRREMRIRRAKVWLHTAAGPLYRYWASRLAPG